MADAAPISPPEKSRQELVREQFAKDREERKVRADLLDFARKTEGHNQAHAINPRRYEASSRTYSELNSPPIPEKKKNDVVTPPAASGTPIDFYCYYNGQLGTISVLTNGFKPYTS